MSERNLDEKPARRPKKPPRSDSPAFAGPPGATCKTCLSPHRPMIEQQIIEGKPWMQIARSVHSTIHYQSIRRHAVLCIPDIMGKRAESMEQSSILTRELIEDHAHRLLERADTVVEDALDHDDEGAPKETAMGRAAALRAHGDSVKIAGQVIGMFDSKTKLEILLKDASTQEALMKLIDALCPECCVAAKEVLAGLVT